MYHFFVMKITDKYVDIKFMNIKEFQSFTNIHLQVSINVQPYRNFESKQSPFGHHQKTFKSCDNIKVEKSSSVLDVEILTGNINRNKKPWH